MDKIVALCKRRGFIFPSSRDLRRHRLDLRLRPLRRPAQDERQGRVVARDAPERDDIVALDSRDPPAPARVGGLGPPRRLHRPAGRLPHLQAALPRRPPRRAGRARASRPSCPGEGRDCDLTEARDFNLMFETTVGPVKESGVGRLPAPRDRAGHLRQLQERPAVHAQEAAVRHRAGRQVVPQRDHARATSSSARASSSRWRWSSSCRPAEARQWYEYWKQARCDWYEDLGLRARPPAPARARRRRALALLAAAPPTSSTCSRSAGRSSRASPTAATSTSPSTREFSGEKLEYFDQATGERYVPHVIEPAAGADRATLAFLVDAYDEEEVERRARAPCCAAPAPGAGQGRRCCRSSARTASPRSPREVVGACCGRYAGRVRRGRLDRQALPPPGRDRHAVVRDRRPPDARGPHGHRARPRLAGPGARSRSTSCPAELAPAARGAVALAEARRCVTSITQ